MWEDVFLPLESVILFIGGMALAVTGVLLFFVFAGQLPYDETGFFGILLVVFSLQIITLGKTPFGEVRRSKFLLGFGIITACIGIITCCIPGILGPAPRILLAACFGFGGLLQFLQACLDKAKLQTWLQYGGIFYRLFFACLAVQGLSTLVGVLLWAQPSLPNSITATILILFGLMVIYLADVLRQVYCRYPKAERKYSDQFDYSFDRSMLLLTGVFMILVGILLIPVNLGLLPFSASAQLGLLMIIFAIQMIVSGNTPLGPFPHRSLLMIGLGILFAAMGIVSCVIPGVLADVLTFLVGMLNIFGGLIPLGRRLLLFVRSANTGRAQPLLLRISRVQLILNLLSVMFGASMLIPGMIPGLVVSVILAANGGVLLYLLQLLVAVAALNGEAG